MIREASLGDMRAGSITGFDRYSIVGGQEIQDAAAKEDQTGKQDDGGTLKE